VSLPPISPSPSISSTNFTGFFTAKCLAALHKLYEISVKVLILYSPKDRDDEDLRQITDITNQFPIFNNLPQFVRQGLAKIVRYERRNPNEVGT
jgi:hypothetical protein